MRIRPPIVRLISSAGVTQSRPRAAQGGTERHYRRCLATCMAMGIRASLFGLGWPRHGTPRRVEDERRAAHHTDHCKKRQHLAYAPTQQLGARVRPGLTAMPSHCFITDRPLFYLIAMGSPCRTCGAVYANTFDTTPAPTVLPPSRKANRIPSSIAIGWTNSQTTSALSPGITICRSSGSITEAVTSAVRKKN